MSDSGRNGADISQLDEHPLCAGCGYDLHALAEEGLCPECATPVLRSIQGDCLALADPKWVRGLSLGVTLIWVACVTAVASLILMFAAFVIPGAILMVIPALAFITVPLMLLAGVVLLTRPDPRLFRVEQSFALRRIVRLSSLITAVVPIAEMSLRRLTTPRSLLIIAHTCRVVALSVLAVSGLLYLSRLAWRLPNQELAIKTRSIARQLSALIPLYYVMAYLDSIYGGMVPGNVWRSFIFLAAFFLGLVILLRGISAMVLMESYRVAFRSCWQEARSLSDASNGPDVPD